MKKNVSLLVLLYCISHTLLLAQNSWHEVGGGLHYSGIKDGVASLLRADNVNNLLYLTGGFSSAGTNNIAAHKVAVWNGSQYASLGCPTGADWQFLPTPDKGVCINGSFIAGCHGCFPILQYCAVLSGPVVANHIARYDGTEWVATADPIAAGLLGSLNAITSYQGNLVITGSDFTSVTTGTGLVSPNSIALANGSTWQLLGSPPNHGVTYPAYPTSNYVWDAIEYNGELFVCGIFSHAGGASLTSFGVARWNGQTWSSAGTVPVTATKFGVANGELYLSGLGIIHKWDGAEWVQIGATNYIAATNGFFSMTEWNNSLVVTGTFDSINGIAARNIALWDGVQWQPLGGGIYYCNSSTSNMERGMTLASYKGSLYVGGGFDCAGGVNTGGFARWGPATAIEEALTTVEFTLSPNPATNQITISLKDGSTKNTVYIYDVTGKLQLEERFNSSGVHQLDISTLTNGIYIVEVRDAKGNAARRKLVKQ